MPNNIFTSSKVRASMALSPYSAIYPFIDKGKMDRSTGFDLDTYRNWGGFQLLIEPAQDDTEEGVPVVAHGVKSIFNNANATYFSNDIRMGNNAPMLDSPVGRAEQRLRTDCTIGTLVRESEAGMMGRAVYSYADFAYCKYLGRVTNNYLITLRRFPTPAGNHITFSGNPPTMRESLLQDHQPDIGRLVTWLGTPGNEMSNILKYSYKMNWKEEKAEINDVEASGNNSTPLAQLFNAADPAYQKQVQQGYAGSGLTGKSMVDAAFSSDFGSGSNKNGDTVLGYSGSSPGSGADEPYSSLRAYKDQNKVYGPLDVIQRTNIRDRGLEFTHEINLTFDYEMRSYDGINGKAAMLDLLGNILAVTFTNGKFWGGGYRYTGAHQSDLFANLPIFKLADSGGLGDSTAVLNSFADSLTAIGNDLKAKGNGSTISGIIETIKGMGGMLLGGVLNKLGRPQKFSAASLLSPAATGVWHLTVGNPRAPILEVGNLILTEAEIEHYGPLGIDDFPTGLRVKVKLKHGKDKDAALIEQMYLRGDNRIYCPMSSEIMKMYNQASDLGEARKNFHNELVEKRKKTANGSDDTDRAASSPNRNLENSDMAKDKRMQDVLNKYFGTQNLQKITIAGQEASWGSVEERPKKDQSKKGPSGKTGIQT